MILVSNLIEEKKKYGKPFKIKIILVKLAKSVIRWAARLPNIAERNERGTNQLDRGEILCYQLRQPDSSWLTFQIISGKNMIVKYLNNVCRAYERYFIDIEEDRWEDSQPTETATPKWNIVFCLILPSHEEYSCMIFTFLYLLYDSGFHSYFWHVEQISSIVLGSVWVAW